MEVGSLICSVIISGIRVSRTSLQAGEGRAGGDWWRARQLEQSCIRGSGRYGQGVQVVAWEGALKGRDREADLKRY